MKVLNPSECLLKLYECSLRPDQNKAQWQVPVYDIPLFMSDSPKFPLTDMEGEKTDREKGEERGKKETQGTWRVFRRKMAVSSCQSLTFWCHRLGTGLSVSRCGSYQRLTHSRQTLGWKHRKICTFSHFHLAHKLRQICELWWSPSLHLVLKLKKQVTHKERLDRKQLNRKGD